MQLQAIELLKALREAGWSPTSNESQQRAADRHISIVQAALEAAHEASTVCGRCGYCSECEALVHRSGHSSECRLRKAPSEPAGNTVQCTCTHVFGDVAITTGCPLHG